MTTPDILRLDTDNEATPGDPASSSALTWRFKDCAHRSGPELALAASRSDCSPAGWVEARVPGLATADLIRERRIADPFWGENLQEARFIEERDFVYRTELVLTAEQLAKHPRARLVFDSLDTFASVFLNGKLITTHENQFKRLFVDVSDALVPGKNRLAIAFEASMPATVRRAGQRLAYWNEPWERLYVRKSQMSFGWDWAPRLPTVGIPGRVRLELGAGVFSDDLWLVGEPKPDASGLITARVEYRPHETFKGTVELVVDGAIRVREDVTFHAGHAQTVTLSDTVAKAHLWHPRELGKPHLYRVEVKVLREDRVVHRHAGRCGIRQVTLERGEPGARRFELLVNGQKLFCKGENWIPPDLLHTRTSDRELRDYLALLVEGGVNLVRVWGGGIIERQAFYDACDELGLLVWQDFPYACGIYPDTDEFLREAAEEAGDIVRRLRSHACLALWCGNNENEVLAEREAPSMRFHQLYYGVLAEVTARLDPHRPYWPGSPASESRETPADSPAEGDRHNWDVWFQFQDYERITDDARFCSEFGAQAFPQRETLESIMPHDELWAPGTVSRPRGPSPGLLFARRGAQLEKLFARSFPYASPTDLDTVIAATQAFQADVVGGLLRHYRRLPHSGGVIVWNYTSTWPSICWALVDWYRRPKQAFYAARRAFAELMIGIEPDDDSGRRYTAFVSLDRPGTVSGTVTFALCDLTSGKELAPVQSAVDLKGPDAVDAVAIELPESRDPRSHALVARFEGASSFGPRSLCSVRYLGPLRELCLYETSRKSSRAPLRATWNERTVRLVSERWRLRVGVESFEPGVVWDDNYVDLLPGEEKVLTLQRGEPKHLWLVADFGRRAPLPLGKTVEL